MQEIRSPLLRLPCADHAGAGKRGDRPCGCPGPIIPHHLLQVRGLRVDVVVRVRGTGLLSFGRSRPLQELQCETRAEHDDRVVSGAEEL